MRVFHLCVSSRCVVSRDMCSDHIKYHDFSDKLTIIISTREKCMLLKLFHFHRKSSNSNLLFLRALSQTTGCILHSENEVPRALGCVKRHPLCTELRSEINSRPFISSISRAVRRRDFPVDSIPSELRIFYLFESLEIFSPDIESGIRITVDLDSEELHRHSFIFSDFFAIGVFSNTF